jgi:hypothetical protein
MIFLDKFQASVGAGVGSCLAKRKIFLRYCSAYDMMCLHRKEFSNRQARSGAVLTAGGKYARKLQ